MLKCKDVAILASEYLDKETNAPVHWKIRMHLMMCANCRRFMRHLKITRTLSQKLELTSPAIDTEHIWKELQKKIHQDSQPD